MSPILNEALAVKNRKIASVLVTFVQTASPVYPIATVPVFEDGTKGQECIHKTMREAKIYANGVAWAVMHFQGELPEIIRAEALLWE